MECFVLIGGLVYIGVLGYYVVDKFGKFLDHGGISPFWDEAEEAEAAEEESEITRQ